MIPLPNIWSRYAGAGPLALPLGRSTPEDRVKVADVVLLIRRPSMVSTSPGGYGHYYRPDPKPADRIVRVVRNTTWDRIVGKEVRLTSNEWSVLSYLAEQAPDELRRRWGPDEMVCLIRSR